MKRLILLLLFFTIAYAQAQDAAPDSSKLINPAFTFFKSHNGSDTSIYGKSGSDWWNFARQTWVNKYFLRSADSAKYVTIHYFNTHGSSTTHTDSLFALAEKSANKTATPSVSTTLYPNWQGVSNYAYPLTGNPSGFISTITGITAGGDLTGTYPNPTVNTINGKTVSYYDFTSSGQSQLNSKQATLVSGANIKTINGTSILGSGNLTISGGGSSYTANQPLSISGSTISLDTTTAITGVETKGAALTQYNSLTGQINLATQALTDDPGIPALTGYTSNVAVAYGTIRLYPSATKAFRLRRSSDNVQQDFYFDTNGNVNQDDINKFVDGFRGYVTIWYDQSGNSNDAIQSTPSLQPYIIIENGIIKVRFEDLYSTNLGQALTYTLKTGLDVSNTTVFCAYAPYTANGMDQVYPTPNFTSRYFISSANAKLDLFIDGANSSHPNSLTLNASNTSSLFAWEQGNYFSINSNGSAAKVRSNYCNPVLLTALSSYTETQFKIGNKYSANGQPFTGDIYAYIQYSTSQADAVIDTLANRLKIPYNLVSPSDNNINIAIVGDSESNGNKATNNQNWAKQLNNILKTPVINLSTIANTYAIQNGNTYNTAVDQQIVSGKINVLYVWLGTNDLSGATAAPRTSTQVYNDAVAYAQARHTAGWNKVIMLTAMDRGSVGTWITFNNILKANTTDFDGVLDVASDSRLLWMPGFGGNTTTQSAPDFAFFASDNIHLTNTGYKVISSYVDNNIETLMSTNTQINTLSRRVKVLESNISQLQSLSILNRNAIQHGYMGIDSGLYTRKIWASQKPLDTLFIDANKTPLLSNAGYLILNSQGYDHVMFGPKNHMYTSAYTFAYGAGAFSNLTVAFNNYQQTPTVLQFFNDNSFSSATNSNISIFNSSNTITMSTYTLHDMKIESNQGNVYLSTVGTPGLGVHPANLGGAYVALAGTYGYATSSTSFLNLSVGLASPSGSPLKFMPGVVGQTTIEQGAVNFDGTYWYGGSGSSSVNKRFAFFNAHTIFTPTTGNTITLLNNQQNIINPTASLAALTITFPTSPLNNDVVYIKYTQSVSSITYAGGTVIAGPVSAASGDGHWWTYDSSSSSWY